MSHAFNFCPNCATGLQLLAKLEDGGEKQRMRAFSPPSSICANSCSGVAQFGQKLNC